MILARIKPWWKRASVQFMGLFCLTCKSIEMAFLMKGCFDTLEQQWYYCHPTISFQELELYISHKNAFIRVGKHSFMRLTRRRFSIRTSELSEGHFFGVKKMAAGLTGHSHQDFSPLTFIAPWRPKTLSLFPSDFLGFSDISDSLVFTRQQRLNIHQRTYEQIPQTFKPWMLRKAST